MKNLFQKTQRVLLSVAASLLATACLTSCEKTSDNVQPEPTAAPAAPNLAAPQNMRGINVNLRDGVVDFNRIVGHRFNTVRIVIDVNDYHYMHGGIGAVGALMRQANQAGLSVVLVYYNHAFMDPNHYRSDAMTTATNFWVANLPYLNGLGIAFYLNIINEPCFKSGNTYQITGAQWRDEQNTAVSRIRARGFSSPIIIDSPGFAHETSYIRARGSEVAPNSPIIYSLHVYPDSFYAGALPTNPADDLSFMTDLRQHAGHRVIIGEFGDSYDRDGVAHENRARVQAFVNSAQASSADCGAIAWAWNGDGTLGNMNASLDYGYLGWIEQVIPN